MKYYLGGYYLIKLKSNKIGNDEEKYLYTCSDCVNDNLVDSWAYTWTTENDKQAVEAKETFKISDDDVTIIRKWVDTKHNQNKIGWVNVFTEFETAIDYKNTFFGHLTDIKLLALYFDENERNALIDEFKPQSEKFGEIGLRLTLLREIEETEVEKFLGFDYIGIENGGSFHTFHCHEIGNELCNKFNLTMNNFGLFENRNNANQVLDYLNDEANGCEPVPWFIAKTKIVEIE